MNAFDYIVSLMCLQFALWLTYAAFEHNLPRAAVRLSEILLGFL